MEVLVPLEALCSDVYLKLGVFSGLFGGAQYFECLLQFVTTSHSKNC